MALASEIDLPHLPVDDPVFRADPFAAVEEAAVVAGGRPALLLTGGAAADVLPYLRCPVESMPDLVLRGLAVLAGADSV